MLNLNLPNLPFDTMLSLVIAGIVGLAFAFFRGATLPRFIGSVIASCAGFFLGQLIANALQFQFLMVGSVHLIEGLLGSLLLLFIVNS
jgi:uncharacterized membrane protein YeaQ/YmgE (transglycosylase-associated protein family)